MIKLQFLQEISMQTLTASEARANLYRLIDQTAESHEPVTITGKRTNAVLLSADDYDGPRFLDSHLRW